LKSKKVYKGENMKNKQCKISTKTFICINCKKKNTFSLLDINELTFGCIAFLHLFCPKCYESLKIEKVIDNIVSAIIIPKEYEGIDYSKVDITSIPGFEGSINVKLNKKGEIIKIDKGEYMKKNKLNYSWTFCPNCESSDKLIQTSLVDKDTKEVIERVLYCQKCDYYMVERLVKINWVDVEKKYNVYLPKA